jgi:CRP-like cAMP-binding protein
MDPRDRKLVDLLPTIAVLKQTDFFKDMRANDLASLAEAAEERIFEPGAKILTEGKVPDAFYIVCEGKVRVVMEGRELWQFGAPNCVGDVTLLDGGPETLTCEVIERVRALAVVAEDFESLVMTEPVLARAILKKMAHRCIDLVKAAYAKT